MTKFLDTWEQVAAVVQTARAAGKLTRDELAQQAGVSVHFLEGLESVAESDDREALLRVLAVLGVEAASLPFQLPDPVAERARFWAAVKRAEHWDPPVGQYLRPRPAETESARVLIALDVDGVVSRFSPLLTQPPKGLPWVVGLAAANSLSTSTSK